MKSLNIKTIIVGADLSLYSKTVAREAKALAKKFKTQVVFVYAFPDAAIFKSSMEVRKSVVVDFYENQVRKFYQLKKSDTVLVRFGRPHDEIIQTAKAYPNPLIIVGYRGHNPIARMFVGSTAERLAIHSPFPVWIHKGSKVALPKKILVPCDLSPRSTHTIEELDGLQKAFKAKLELYHVMQEPIPVMDFDTYAMTLSDAQKRDDKKVLLFKKKYPSLKTDRILGGVGERITDYSRKFDLVALSPKPRKNGPLIFGNVTEKLLRSGDKPVLVVP